jgi:TolB-like protein/tetratricopeptide (TPR) repeat protein
MSSFFEELQRRNVIKATIAYVVMSWVLLQVASIVLPIVNAPEWVLKTFSFFLVLGFPIWVFISWVYEVTPEGLKKTKENTQDRGVSETTNKRLNILIFIGIVAAISATLLKPSSGYISSSNNVEYAIAVLPFDDMSSSGDTEWFCDGVTEDILTHLSKIKGLKVISRTSTERYKNTDKSMPEIAAELGVSYIVEGSVRKQNDDVLITAQLINANDEHVWADNFNEKMTDVFKIQGEVSKKIVNQLKIKISPEEERELSEFPTDNMEAYQAYLKGRSFMEKTTPEDGEIAIEFFEKAIELDPNYAEAYAELGFLFGSLKRDNLAAETYINKAVEINPNSSRAISYKGVFLNIVKQKPDEGIVYLEKAIELNPSDAVAHNLLAIYYSNNQSRNKNFKPDLDKALYHSNKALDLDPFSTLFNSSKISVLLKQKLYDQAEALFQEKIEMFPKNLKSDMARRLISGRINENRQNGDSQEEEISILEQAIITYPFNEAIIIRQIGTVYDGLYNDDASYLKYTERAYMMDSTSGTNALNYHAALIENKRFEKAKTLGDTKNYIKEVSPLDQLGLNYYYYYTKGKYQKALEILDDSLLKNNDNSQYARRAFVNAQLGNKAEISRILRSGKLTNINKAMIYAILKERDSMYYYLNHEDNSPVSVRFPNSRHELDPYRKEPRYLEILNKNKFPVDEQKN